MQPTVVDEATEPLAFSATLDRGVERMLVPLDRLRTRCLRSTGRPLRRLLRLRSERVAVQAALLTCTSFALALAAPLWLLTWGPLLLGVPHLVADVRYLVARNGLWQRPGFRVLVVPCLAACMVEPRASWGILAVICAAAMGAGSWLRRGLVLALCAATWAGASAAGPVSDVLFAHAHNFVALGCWAFWARDSRWQLWPALGLCLLGCACLLGGSADPLLTAAFGARIDGLSALSPSGEPRWILRYSACFAFMQSVHYGVWLRTLPEEDRARPGLRSFQSSFRALRVDFGSVLLLSAAIAALVLLLLAATVDPESARLGYLRLAMFHGPMELAVLALAWIERRTPRAS